MRIGIDIRTLMDRQYSGVSEHTLNLVREILKQDKANEYKLFYNSGRDVGGRIEKNLFAGELPELSSGYPELSSEEGRENAEIVNTRYPNKIFNWPMQKVLSLPRVDKMLGVDIFYCPNLAPIALSKKCRKVITVHDLSFLRYPEFFNFKRRLWHWAINARKFLNQFDVIVAVSENTKNDIVDLLGISEKKIRVIYSGAGEGFRTLDHRSRIMDHNFKNIIEKYNLPERFILFLGTLEPRKNVAGLIRAYNIFRDENKGLSDIKLVIAGGKGWKAEEIFMEWKKSKYKDDIRFLGYVEPEEKACLYNLAKAFVFPSFYEGFGFPPLEAMASGAPVVTSFSSSLGEVAGEAALTVDPYNIGDLAKAMELIIADKTLRDKLKAKGLKQAKKFNWAETARKYLEVFNELR